MATNSVNCPSCKFPNAAGAKVCLTCKEPLPQASSGQEEERPSMVSRHLQPAPWDPPERRTLSPASKKMLGWLRCEATPSLPLLRNTAVTLGRSRDCDLVLPHPTVSRLHAIVETQGSKILFSDQSSYGSVLNGRVVHKGRLSFGDRLLIGPFEVRVEPPESIDEGSEDDDITRPLDLSGFRESQASLSEDTETAELIGSLERASLVEVIQSLEFNRKTGTLKILSPEQPGALGVREGKPTYAELGKLSGAQAVLAMLKLRSGGFCFTGELDRSRNSMSGSLTTILLRASGGSGEDEGMSEKKTYQR